MSFASIAPQPVFGAAGDSISFRVVPSTGAADAAAYRAFADRLEDGLKRRLASQPAGLHSFVQTVVLAKHGSARVA